MHDVVVIGAGMAGLTVATELARRNQPAIVLEARDRPGGRCWTLHDNGSVAPVELGAEFIHGAAEATAHTMRAAGLAVIDAPQSRWVTRGRHLQRANDLFEELVGAFQGVRIPGKGDISFAQLLALPGVRLSPTARRMALMIVEGLDAADPKRISAREVMDEWSGDSMSGDRQGRPFGGYSELVRALGDQITDTPPAIAASRAATRLDCTVECIRWRPGAAIVEGMSRGAPFTVEAKRVVVSVPLGVLQQPVGTPGAIRFDPPLPDKLRAMSRLASGPVVKLVMRFRSAFWEEVDRERYRDAAFFHSDRGRMPTFWTALPVRAPLLVGWAGGPKADALAGLDRASIVDIALQDLRALMRTRRRLDSQLEAAWFHDWQADPLARGAYSYVMVGGQTARRQLARPVADTLYFAGEATDDAGEAATVAGAIASGRRAAREVLRAIARD